MPFLECKNLILMVGPEGVGKKELIKKIKEKIKIYEIITTTTRPKKTDEKEGEDFYFIHWDDFRKLVEKDKLVNSFQKGGNYYGVTETEFEKALQSELPVVWMINLKEATKIKTEYPNVKIIFIAAPLESIRKKLESRGIVAEGILNSMLIKAKFEMDQAPGEADHIVVNEIDNQEKSVNELVEIINNKQAPR